MQEAYFRFRPWVRKTCRSALLWGIGVVAIMGGFAFVLHGPESAPISRAFGVLLLYGALFLLTLLKVWWTAGWPAVTLTKDELTYQPLHTFRPRKVPLDRIVSCAPREGTHSLRFVVRRGESSAREFFLNLAVIDERHRFLDELGERLATHGLEPIVGRKDSWRHPVWSRELPDTA